MDPQNQPASRARREQHIGDMAAGQRPPIAMPNSGILVREQEEIEALDTPMSTDHFEILKFNEDTLTIRLERSSEKNAPQVVSVAVQGVEAWIPVGKPWKVKRKFVEVLARAKKDSIETESKEVDGDELTRNLVHRFSSNQHPFSVLHDPSPLGPEWLTRLIAEY